MKNEDIILYYYVQKEKRPELNYKEIFKKISDRYHLSFDEIKKIFRESEYIFSNNDNLTKLYDMIKDID